MAMPPIFAMPWDFCRNSRKNGAQLIGSWPANGYEHDFSKAQRGDVFVGLCLDTDNQDDLTEERISKWTSQIIDEFGL